MKKITNQSTVSSHTLSEKIFKHLKDEIIRNEIKANALLNKRKIASQFNVSMTPVRDAIMKLEGEGYVEFDENRNAIVKEISYEKFQEMNETMSLLDRYACKIAFTTLSEEALQKLEDLNSKMEGLCKPDTLEEYLEINSQFHLIVWKSIQNEYLFSLIVQVYEHYLKTQRQILFSQWIIHTSYLKKSLKQHKNLLKAFKNKDNSLLNRILKNHWPAW